MCEALHAGQDSRDRFLSTYPNCFPPLVINITDGKPTDGNPLDAAVDSERPEEHGRQRACSSTPTCRVRPLRRSISRGEERALPDKYAKLLFRMSSILPPKLMAAARDDGYPVNGPARGFVFNADLVAVIRFLDIGTRVATPGR